MEACQERRNLEFTDLLPTFLLLYLPAPHLVEVARRFVWAVTMVTVIGLSGHLGDPSGTAA